MSLNYFHFSIAAMEHRKGVFKMAIHFECPYCKEGLRAPEKAVGKTAKCTKCKKKIIVPEKKEVLVPGKDEY